MKTPANSRGITAFSRSMIPFILNPHHKDKQPTQKFLEKKSHSCHNFTTPKTYHLSVCSPLNKQTNPFMKNNPKKTPSKFQPFSKNKNTSNHPSVLFAQPSTSTPQGRYQGVDHFIEIFGHKIGRHLKFARTEVSWIGG